MDTHGWIVTALALLAGLALGVLLGATLVSAGLLRRDRSALGDQLGVAMSATTRAVAPVRESLDRFDSRLRELEASRVEWHAQLREQVESVRVAGESLRRETASLATALSKPAVRGRWGEMHLQRAVEIAGLVERVDFTPQVTLQSIDGVLRPDLLVHLAGDKCVVVDAKVPLEAFLDATGTEDPAEHQAHLERHARQLRAHADALAAKSYWRQLATAPEFVVLFVPGEAFLSAALQVDAGLLEHAADRRVVLATPTTLIALLRTVAYAWTQESLAAGAREVHSLARDLYERLGTLGTHVDRLGRSLGSAVGAYNKAVASLETRVLVTARRLHELDVGDEPLARPRPVEESVRPLSASELLVTDPRSAVEGPAEHRSERAG